MFERFSHRGWNNAYRLSNGVVELVVTAEVGPRILFCGFRDGVNQLHEVAEDAGKAGGSEFRLYGTHRLWVSPEAERTYYPVFPTLLRLRCHNTITPSALWHRQRSCRQEPTRKKELEIELAATGLAGSDHASHQESRCPLDNARAVVTHDDAIRGT